MDRKAYNRGIIESFPRSGAEILGSTPKSILRHDKNYELFLPSIENQYREYFDSKACVTFSAWNCIETAVKCKYGLQINKSDRFTAKISGTDIFGGNYLERVYDYIREHFSVDESEYPFEPQTASINQINDAFQIYYKPLTPELVSKAHLQKAQGNWDVSAWWVGWGGNIQPIDIWNALAYGPIQATVYTWGPLVNGIYQRANTNEITHAIMIYGGSFGNFFNIFDHYDNTYKKLSWNYYFSSAFQYSVNCNTMLKLIKGDARSEIYALGNDGKLRHIGGEGSFIDGIAAGIFGGVIETRPQNEIDAMPKGSVWGAIK